MSNKTNPTHSDKLDVETVELLSSASAPLDLDTDTMEALRARVMAQIDTDSSPGFNDLLTIRADEGEWTYVSDHITKKLLHTNQGDGTETFLLRVLPGAEDVAHTHNSDEHCLVLEGGISFGDVHLNAGDYHLAPKGSHHSAATSPNGALLLIQTGMNQQVSI